MVYLNILKTSQENTCVEVSFNKIKLIKLQASQGCNVIKKETLTQMSSCEFCEFFQNIIL